jgi:hypothetical protein
MKKLALLALLLSTSAQAQVIGSPPGQSTAGVPIISTQPNAYPCSPQVADPPIGCSFPLWQYPLISGITSPGFTGHVMTTLDQNVVFGGNNVYPFGVLGQNPYVQGTNVHVLNSAVGRVHALRFTSASLTGSPITISFQDTSTNNVDSANGLCANIRANPTLFNAQSLPVICDPVTGGGTMNVQWDARYTDLMVTDVSTPPASITVPTLIRAIDFITINFGRYIPGYAAAPGDASVCIQLVGQTINAVSSIDAQICSQINGGVNDAAFATRRTSLFLTNVYNGASQVEIGLSNGMILYGAGNALPTGGYIGPGTINVPGGFYVNGSLVTGGGGGTPGGPASSVQLNSGTGFTGSANLEFDGVGLLGIGTSGTSTGRINLSGATSGVVTFQAQAVAGTWTFQLPANAGTSGQVLQTNGAGVTSWTTVTGGGGGTPGGANGAVQFNNSGAFGGVPAFQFDGIGLLGIGTAGTTLGRINLSGNTSGTVTVQPQAAAGTWTFRLPNSAGTSGQVLQTDGTGITSWATVAGGGGTPGGPSASIQFNNAGAFGGSANATLDSSGNITAAGTVTANAATVSPGNLVMGSGALAQSATSGFIYTNTMVGSPTGTPTAITGRAPLAFDSFSKVLWVYTGGAWASLGQGGSWVTYTSTVTCQSGGPPTLGTVVAREMVVGKTVYYNIVIPVTNIGTCATSMEATLPATTQTSSDQFCGAGADAGNAYTLSVVCGPGSTQVIIRKYDGTFPANNSSILVVGGVYESS